MINQPTLDESVRDLEAYTSLKWMAWGVRPILLFAAGYTIIGILHEWSHALMAFALKVPSTLFHLYVHLNRTDGTINQRSVIGVAGPLFCLVLGLVCGFAYRNTKGSRAGLLLLYLAWFGTSTFFGNLISTPFVGDFSSLALAFHLPMSVRYALAVVGLLSLSGLSFLIGRELRTWVPVGVSAVRAMVGMIVIPAIVGQALAILIFLPMPFAFAITRVGESAFWIFAVVGILISRKQSAETSRGLGWSWMDLAFLLVPILLVRTMVGGITLVP